MNFWDTIKNAVDMSIQSIQNKNEDKLIAAIHRLSDALLKLATGQGDQGKCATKEDLNKVEDSILKAIAATQATSEEDEKILEGLLTRIEIQSRKLEALDRKT